MNGKRNGYNFFNQTFTSLQWKHGKTIQANAWVLIEHGYGLHCTDNNIERKDTRKKLKRYRTD
ncbi:hypothetical protein [Dubosiella newyorkensis]|uniref:hypothetical protein n=1 Tax=Dubosiella newyorkensis TaxID=1862672 RepID=UPI003F66E8EE